MNVLVVQAEEVAMDLAVGTIEVVVVAVVVMNVVELLLELLVDTLLGLTLNDLLHVIPLSIGIILLYLRGGKIPILHVMDRTMYRQGGLVRDMMIVLGGDRLRILEERIMVGVIGETLFTLRIW